MEFTAVISIFCGLITVAGFGYKVNQELSKIRLMIEVFMAKADGKWEKLDDLSARVKVLERKVIMKATGEQ